MIDRLYEFDMQSLYRRLRFSGIDWIYVVENSCVAILSRRTRTCAASGSLVVRRQLPIYLEEFSLSGLVR